MGRMQAEQIEKVLQIVLVNLFVYLSYTFFPFNFFLPILIVQWDALSYPCDITPVTESRDRLEKEVTALIIWKKDIFYFGLIRKFSSSSVFVCVCLLHFRTFGN